MKITNCAYINMDHRTDKNAFILKQLSSCPPYIKIQKFSGIRVPNFLEYSVHSYIHVGSPTHMGVIGCWMAHQSVINSFMNDPSIPEDEWILILEDDIFINHKFWHYLSIIQPIKDTDIIFFDTIKKPIDPQYIINHELKISHIYTTWPFFVGTHCYAISKKSLNKVYNILSNVTVYKDIDGYIFGNSDIIKYNYQSGLISLNGKLTSDRLNAK